MEDEIALNSSVLGDDTSAPEDTVSPDMIDILAPSVFDKPYDEGIAELGEIYSNTNWSDKKQAADKLATAYDRLNKIHDRTPEFELKTDASKLAVALTDKSLNKDLSIKAIEDWRTESKETLLNSEDPMDLVTGVQKEKLIDDYATSLRRSVISGETGVLKDSMVRGFGAALQPLAGSADLIFGSELAPGLQQYTLDNTNPNRDETLTAAAASVAGNIAGFAASSINPYTAGAYLGSVLANQAKETYERAFEETGSDMAAKEAVVKSFPGQAVGALADRFVAGGLTKAFKGVKQGSPLLSALGEMTAEVGETYITGQALSSATGNKELEATSKDLALSAFGGAFGGGLAGTGADLISSYAGLTPEKLAELNENTQSAVFKTKEEARNAVRAIWSKRRGGKKGAEAPASPTLDVTNPKSIAESYIPEEMIGATPEEIYEADGTSFGNEPEFDLMDSIEEKREKAENPALQDEEPSDFLETGAAIEEASSGEISPNTYDQAPTQDTETPQEFTKILSIPEVGFTPMPVLNYLVGKLGSSVDLNNLTNTWGYYQQSSNKIGLSRKIFFDPISAHKTFAHEVGHLIDYADSNMTVAQKRREPVVDKLIKLKDYVLEASNFTEQVRQQAKALSKKWRPGWREDRNSDYDQYRARTSEQQADVLSAIINNPEMVKTEFPALWDSFEAGLANQPEVKQFWEQNLMLNNEPQLLSDIINAERALGRKRSAAAYERGMSDVYKEFSLKNRFKQAGKQFNREFVNQFGASKKLIDKISNPILREEAFKNYLGLKSVKNVGSKLEYTLDGPMMRFMDKLKKSSFMMSSCAFLSCVSDQYIRGFASAIIRSTPESPCVSVPSSPPIGGRGFV